MFFTSANIEARRFAGVWRMWSGTRPGWWHRPWLKSRRSRSFLLNKASFREYAMSFPEIRLEVAKKSPLLLNKASVREKVMSFPEKAKKVASKREKRPVSIKNIYIQYIKLCPCLWEWRCSIPPGPCYILTKCRSTRHQQLDGLS